jgi:hypothetical protein
MTRLILCAGMMRSGGTWLFNAAKMICAQAGRSAYGVWIHDFDAAASAAADDTIVKIHSADDALAAKAGAIFTCHRDLRDVAISLQAMQWIHGDPAKLGLLAQTVEEYEYWAPRAALDFRYDAIVEQPADCIARIAGVLNVSVDPQRIADALDAIALPTKPGYDRETLLHPNHRHDGRPGRWRGQLDERVLIAIETRFGDWLRAKGY